MRKTFGELNIGEVFTFNNRSYTSTKNVEYFSERNILVNACKDYREVF